MSAISSHPQWHFLFRLCTVFVKDALSLTDKHLEPLREKNLHNTITVLVGWEPQEEWKISLVVSFTKKPTSLM